MDEVDDLREPSDNGAFRRALNGAGQVLKRRFRVLSVARTAYERATRHQASVARVKEDLDALIRMARAWARREYTSVPWKVMLYTVAALLYFINPLDLIPDVLAGIGFIDDVAVIASVVRALRGEIDAFEAWEESQHNPRPQVSRRAA